jgi:hypothetical protein
MGSHPQDHGLFMAIGPDNTPNNFPKISRREEVRKGGKEFLERGPRQRGAGEILYLHETLPLSERISFHAL